VLAELGLILGNTGSPLDLRSIGRFSEGIPARAFVGVTSLFLYGTAVLTEQLSSPLRGGYLSDPVGNILLTFVVAKLKDRIVGPPHPVVS
jgi:hypothetical protein